MSSPWEEAGYRVQEQAIDDVVAKLADDLIDWLQVQEQPAGIEINALVRVLASLSMSSIKPEMRNVAAKMLIASLNTQFQLTMVYLKNEGL